MEKKTLGLLSCPLFVGLAPGAVEEILAQAPWEEEEYPKGAGIYAPTAFARKLGILLRGRVAVTRGQLPVSLLGPGDLFGAAALYNGEPDYVTTLTAKSPCTVLFLPQGGMDELLGRYPQVARNYIAYLSQRIRFLSHKVEELAGPTAQERVLRYLAAHGESCTPDCSWTELAGRLGMSRASLYRAMDALEGEGRLKRNGKTIIWIGKDE